MLRIVLLSLLVVIAGVCGFLISSMVLGIVPPPKKLKGKKKNVDINDFFRPLYAFLGKFVYMEERKEAAQKEQLMRAGINLTPKEVMGRSICGIFIGILVSVWGYALKNLLISIMGVVFAVALVGMSSTQAENRLKEKDKEVKKELPKFISTIIVSLRSEKNIIKIIESYAKEAKPALKSDLDVLLSQMNTGNIETALRNFEMRMGAQEITSLTTSLIYIENGIDQTIALQYLETDMRQAQAALRRAELEKLPGKMRRAFIPVAFVLIAIFFYAIGWQILKNFTLFI